jgi:hypothetical protein
MTSPSTPWAYAIAPVVAICKASPRPSNYGRTETFQIVYESSPDAANVWDFRVFSHPDPVVDTTPEMFREVAVDIGRNCPNRFFGEDLDLRSSGKGSARCDEGKSGEKELSAVHSEYRSAQASGSRYRKTACPFESGFTPRRTQS